jgi:hypothetical protein
MSSAWRGANVERAWGHIDAAEEAILHASPSWFLIGQLPRVLSRIKQSLSSEDPRRIHVEELLAKRNGASTAAIDHQLVELLSSCTAEQRACTQGVVEAMRRLHQPRDITGADRAAIVAAFHAASVESRRKQTRVRSFRNMLLMCSVVLFLAVGGLALLGCLDPAAAPICFQPKGQVVCPTSLVALNPKAVSGGQPDPAATASEQQAQDQLVRQTAQPIDLLLVMLLGLIAASVAAATALRNARGTSTPYGVPVAVAVLKLPTGALTAVLGILLMRGQFIPGLSALDSPAQIIAWAIVFGYAQQLFTRFVDQRAHSVLESVGGRPDEPPAPAPATARLAVAET